MSYDVLTSWKGLRDSGRDCSSWASKVLKIITTYLCVCVCAQLLSRVRLFSIPGTVAGQVPLSVRFSQQEYWSGLSFPFPGDLPSPGNEPQSLASPALAGGFFITAPPGKPDDVPRGELLMCKPNNPKSIAPVTFLSNSHASSQYFPCPKSSQGQVPAH